MVWAGPGLRAYPHRPTDRRLASPRLAPRPTREVRPPRHRSAPDPTGATRPHPTPPIQHEIHTHAPVGDTIPLSRPTPPTPALSGRDPLTWPPTGDPPPPPASQLPGRCVHLAPQLHSSRSAGSPKGATEVRKNRDFNSKRRRRIFVALQSTDQSQPGNLTPFSSDAQVLREWGHV